MTYGNRPDPGWKDWQYWSRCEKYDHEYNEADVCTDCGHQYESSEKPVKERVNVIMKIGKPA